MPQFSFHHCVADHRGKLAAVELADEEAAREFGIGLAEKILRSQNADEPPITSRIVICDASGEDLDTIISEAF